MSPDTAATALVPRSPGFSPPCSSMAATVPTRSSLSSRESSEVRTSLPQPSRAKARAAALPMPLSAPVTTAVRPRSLPEPW